jgi:hypothetical protein
MKFFMKIGTKCTHKYHKIFSVFWNKYRNGNIAKRTLYWENVMYLEYVLTFSLRRTTTGAAI